MASRFRFSESELDSLRDAVRRAEEGTPGEIVVFVAPRSDAYEEVYWRGAGLGAIIGVVVWTTVSVLPKGWGLTWVWNPAFGLFLVFAAVALGAVAAKLNGSLFRRLAGKTLIQQSVRRKAHTVFLSEGVQETAARTGILLFLSELERRIEILADKGINAVVAESKWQQIVDLVTDRLGDGDVSGALVSGIAACGEVLRDSGIVADTGDQNELTDDIRFEED